MKRLLKISFFAITAAVLIGSFAFFRQPDKTTKNITVVKQKKIQVAILLDVSNSMDGLIDQAKAQLWNMVSVMGKATCDKVTPDIEIALYEYGRPTNPVSAGYVKQISSFTGDLDQLSKKLFSISTNGGDEYCGQVIYTSLKDLPWDPSNEHYKVIFIAGNEDFLQGNLLYTKACDEARKKGVIVNTIYCGDRMQGIKEHWNLSSECGNGSFTVISQNEKIRDIPTPYDSTIMVLNTKLNSTYIGYGTAGSSKMEEQVMVDNMNSSLDKSVALKRAAVKGNAKLYKNSSWDLVDAYNDDEKVIEKIDVKTLPASLKLKTKEEIKAVVKEKSSQRSALQKEIAATSVKRDTYIAVAKSKNNNNNQKATLESEVEKIIKEQAKRFNMIIE